MPTDASGTPYATEVCQTNNEFSTSTPAQLVTSTTYCYKQNDIYYQDMIDLGVVVLIFIGVIMLIQKAKY